MLYIYLCSTPRLSSTPLLLHSPAASRSLILLSLSFLLFSLASLFRLGNATFSVGIGGGLILMLELSPSSVEGVRRRPVAHVGGGGGGGFFFFFLLGMGTYGKPPPPPPHLLLLPLLPDDLPRPPSRCSVHFLLVDLGRYSASRSELRLTSELIGRGRIRRLVRRSRVSLGMLMIPNLMMSLSLMRMKMRWSWALGNKKSPPPYPVKKV